MRREKTYISLREASSILQPYGVNIVTQARRLPGAVMNSVYQVESDAGPLILKIYEWQTATDVSEEIALLQHLQSKLFPCPSIKLTLMGQPVALFGVRPVLVFHVANGNEIELSNATYEHFRNVGRALAQLHLAANNYKMERRFCDLTNISSMLHEIQQSINSADTFLAKATAKYQELQDSGLGTSPRGVIHSDLFPGHILFEYGKSTVVTVLDFEGACDGFLMFDLAATVNLWAYTKGVFKVEAMNAIIRGYNSVRALSAIESSTLVEFMEFAALYWAVWRCHYFAVVCADNSEFRDFHEYEEQLENIEHNRGQLKDQIALALDEC